LKGSIGSQVQRASGRERRKDWVDQTKDLAAMHTCKGGKRYCKPGKSEQEQDEVIETGAASAGKGGGRREPRRKQFE